MKLEQIFQDKLFKKFREKDLSQIETNQIIQLLNQPKGIIWFKQYMEVRETLPNELLKPILISGINYGDVSYPKKWMPDLIRIYSQEQIDKVLFELINQSPFRDKCKLTHLFYWNKFRKITRYKDGKPQEELTVTWNWNGEFYIEEYVKTNLEEIKRRNKIFKTKRYEFLITEFKKYNNLVYRYYIALQLPKSVENYPIQLIGISKEVVEIINNEKFPTWTGSLKEQIKGNLEFEKLLFEELNWRKQ